jgi:hypothetical protein
MAEKDIRTELAKHKINKTGAIDSIVEEILRDAEDIANREIARVRAKESQRGRGDHLQPQSGTRPV